MRKKSVLYDNPVIRKDNKRMALCGNRSLSYCYSYRNIDKRCEGCELIQRVGKQTKTFKKDGKVYATCIHCGRTLTLDNFYFCKKVKEDACGAMRSYSTVIYKCKDCYVKLNRIAKKKRKERENNENKEKGDIMPSGTTQIHPGEKRDDQEGRKSGEV